MSSLKMSYCYLAFRTNVLLNLYCPGHLSYFSPNESEPLRLHSFFLTTHTPSFLSLLSPFLTQHTHTHTHSLWSLLILSLPPPPPPPLSPSSPLLPPSLSLLCRESKCRKLSHLKDWKKVYGEQTVNGQTEEIGLTEREEKAQQNWKNRKTEPCCSVVAVCTSNMQRVSQGRICQDICTCCHTETDTANY